MRFENLVRIADQKIGVLSCGDEETFTAHVERPGAGQHILQQGFRRGIGDDGRPLESQHAHALLVALVIHRPDFHFERHAWSSRLDQGSRGGLTEEVEEFEYAARYLSRKSFGSE